jgi:hypothetical protein
MLQGLSDTELMLLRSYWEHGDGAARQLAWKSAKSAISAAGRDDILDDARARVATWLNNYDSAYWVGQGSIGGGEGMQPGTVRQAAVPPLLDAIVAAVAGDLISETEFDVLSAPMIRLVARADEDD